MNIKYLITVDICSNVYSMLYKYITAVWEVVTGCQDQK